MGKYSDLRKAMAELQEKLKFWCKPDEKGKYPVPNDEELQLLKKQYDNCFWLASQLLNEEGEAKAKAEEFEYAVNVQRLLNRDINAFRFADKGMTIPEIMKESRIKTVNVNNKKIERIGNHLSSRMILSIVNNQGKKVKGYFTERQFANKDKARQTEVDKLAKLYPEYLEQIEIMAQFYEERDFGYRDKKQNNDTITEIIQNKKLECGPTVKWMIDHFVNAMDTAMSKYSQYSDFSRGTENGQNPIDTRNTALYNISAILGIKDVVPKTYSMRLLNGKEVIEGTFMEHAEGEDLDRARTKFGKLDSTALDYSPALKQLADIEILDYICGNNDRHPGNLLYRFDETGTKIIGVSAIDNDMSFTPYLNIKRGGHSGGLKQICCISSSMKEKLDNLDINLIERNLDGLGFNNDAIKGFKERLELLKDRLETDKKGIQVIPDNEFANKKMSDFMEIKDYTGLFPYINNIFMQVGDKIKSIVSTNEEIKQGTSEPQKLNEEIKHDTSEPQKLEEKSKDNKLEEFDLVDTIDNSTISQDVDGLAEVLYSLGNAADNSFENFDEAMTVVSKLKTACIMLSQGDKMINPEQINKLCDAYKNAIEVFHEVVKDSKNITLDENTKDGLAYKTLVEAEEFCKNKLEFYNQMMKKDPEAENSRATLEEEHLAALDEERISAMKDMKPFISRKDAFDTIKTLVTYYNETKRENPEKDMSAIGKQVTRQINDFVKAEILRKEDLNDPEIKDELKDFMLSVNKNVKVKTEEMSVQHEKKELKGDIVELPSALSRL